MLEFIAGVGADVLINIIQLACGCVLSILIARFFGRHNPTGLQKPSIGIMVVLISAAAGIILPLGPFGMVPVAAGLFYAGFGLCEIIPMIVSGLIFNITTPFTDPSFVLRTGSIKIIFAYAAGCIAGFILMSPKLRQERMHKLDSYKLPDRNGFIGNMKAAIYEAVDKVGLYLVLGVVTDALFKKYFLYSFPGWIFGTTYGSKIPGMLSHFGITNPFFSLSVQLFYIIVNIVNFAALQSILKIRGLVFVYAFLAICTATLAMTAFI